MNPVLDELVAALSIAERAPLSLSGSWPSSLASSLAVEECAVSSVAACLLAAADLAAARGSRRPALSLDVGHVAAVVRSEALLRDRFGNRIDGFAPLSRLWRASDGWVRTHANYPWHRAALLAAFDVDDGPDDEVAPRLSAAFAGRSAHEISERANVAGGLAVAAQTVDEWRRAKPGQASVSRPLIRFSSPRGGFAASGKTAADALPASGIRVLDLTRVIAGPTGTRMLGALGADVLRLDNPRRPELPLHSVDGVLGKASALLDFATADGLARLHALLDDADVLVTGYRPGALDRFGLGPRQIAQRHPHVTVVTLSAWGDSGPWGARRGFDSLVQIASGIGWASSPDGERPGALPFQLLDHATGYLVAAAALSALARRFRAGEIVDADLALATTANWLVNQSSVAAEPSAAASSSNDDEQYRTPYGDGWSGIAPAGRLDETSLSWPKLPPRYGIAQVAWGS